MSGSVREDWLELNRQVADTRTRTLVELVIDVLKALEEETQRSGDNCPPTADQPASGLNRMKGSVSGQGRVKKMLILAFTLVPFFSARYSVAQSINEQKKAVVFIFGTIHPVKPDKTPITDGNGKRVAVELPLGTGFFVDYPDQRRGSNYEFSYLVTAKHVLQDADGTFLPNVKIRLNLKTAVGESEVGFISDIPVTDSQGHLLWLHSDKQAEDVAVLPLFPDERQFEFTTIPSTRFLNDRALNSGTVAEGDDLYFIGLMEQYYGTRRNYPLIRRGTLALLTDEDIDTPTGKQKVFIAALESWPGNSGSPVFLRAGQRDRSPAHGNSLSLLGILVASFLTTSQLR